MNWMPQIISIDVVLEKGDPLQDGKSIVELLSDEMCDRRAASQAMLSRLVIDKCLNHPPCESSEQRLYHQDCRVRISQSHRLGDSSSRCPVGPGCLTL